MSTMASNPIQYALQQLKFKIPKQILNMAFKTDTEASFRWGNDARSQSIDSIIRAKVIDARVNEDCNLKGGNQITVDLNKAACHIVDVNTRNYRIPYHLTGGKRIISAQSVSYRNITNSGSTGGNMVASAVLDAYRAMAPMPIVDTAEIEIKGDNIISVRDNYNVLSQHYNLLCTVENDVNMANLKPGAWKVYAKLVELAVKAYIHVNLVIPTDQGAIMQGVTIGTIKEKIDSYSDADEQYEEYYKENWGKTIRSNDRGFMSRMIRSQIGRGQ